MRLTKKKAIEISIELWSWLAETGEEFKADWDGWKKYGGMNCDCPLCEYIERGGKVCGDCPYTLKLGLCMAGVYGKWCDAKTKEDRQEFASQFLEQLKELK